MKRKRTAVFAAAALVCAGSVGAGIVTPPPGSVAPTDRTPINAQYITALPYVISEPGSYVLTSNLYATDLQNGIEVDVSNVTIDLNGFTLFGVPEDGAGVGRRGIEVSSGIEGVTIVNGVIRDWSMEGIQTSSSAEHCVYKDLRIIDNGSTGARLGPNTLLVNCLAAYNAFDGLDLDNNSVVRNCSAYNNGNIGIRANDNCTLIGCVVEGNAFDGISFGGLKGVVTDCAASYNGNSGITSAATVNNCVARENGGVGINARDGTISNSSAWRNGAAGFSVIGSIIRGCTANENGDEAAGAGIGIYVYGHSVVINNQCSNNVEAGILVRHRGQTRIESNDVNNDPASTPLQQHGISVETPDNIILRNTAHGNVTANYTIVAGNSYGPIINVAGVGDISTVGGAEHPWANFEY